MLAQAAFASFPAAVFADARRPFPGDGLLDALTAYGLRLTFERGEEIYGEGEDADHVYQVVSGAVRTCKLLTDGRRQISDFHLAGDVFGLEGGPVRRLSAEAVGSVVVLAARRRVLADLAAGDPEIAGRIWSLTVQTLQRTQDHMLTLARQSACERVCDFLLDLARREEPADRVILAMSRQEIADYLGLTIETVSRTLTQLQGLGWIALTTPRQVELRNREAITRLCS